MAINPHALAAEMRERGHSDAEIGKALQEGLDHATIAYRQAVKGHMSKAVCRQRFAVFCQWQSARTEQREKESKHREALRERVLHGEPVDETVLSPVEKLLVASAREKVKQPEATEAASPGLLTVEELAGFAKSHALAAVLNSVRHCVTGTVTRWTTLEMAQALYGTRVDNKVPLSKITRDNNTALLGRAWTLANKGSG
jgi:hypothetical protein